MATKYVCDICGNRVYYRNTGIKIIPLKYYDLCNSCEHDIKKIKEYYENQLLKYINGKRNRKSDKND